jgi:hypothetical protein
MLVMLARCHLEHAETASFMQGQETVCIISKHAPLFSDSHTWALMTADWPWLQAICCSLSRCLEVLRGESGPLPGEDLAVATCFSRAASEDGLA